MTRTIAVDHLARVEGHGGIRVVVDGNHVQSVELDVFEGIRLFEAMIRGRRVEDVTQIVSRICAICSHGHSITSLLALENALGVEVSPQVRKLRDLAFQGASIQSHALHVFVLALPDLLGHPSVLSVAQVLPDAVKMALRLKRLGNTIQEVVGGRAVHPVNYVIGGFGRLPTADELLGLRRELEARLADCEAALSVLRTLSLPSLVAAERPPIRCAALRPDDRAFFFGHAIQLSDGPPLPVAEYRRLTGEHTVAHSHAKHSRHGGRPYMVGALPRLTLNGHLLSSGLARRAWDELGLRLPATNIVLNNLAQAVELFYSVEHALALVRELLEAGPAPEKPAAYAPHACQGAAASEVPRGILFYGYELDASGRVVRADVITPTAQNLAHAEAELRATAEQGLAAGSEDGVLRERLEIVARAYDPCISCSVHLMRVA